MSWPSFFINHLGRHTRGTANAAHSGATSPPVFTEPPPDYKDLITAKYRLSEDLPRYEDLVKHDRCNSDAASKIFATTSSAQFIPPERINLAFSVSEVDETVRDIAPSSSQDTANVFPRASSSNEVDISRRDSAAAAAVVSDPSPLSGAPPSVRSPVITTDPQPVVTVGGGIDNLAHESW